MVKTSKKETSSSSKVKKTRPALSPEARENQLIAMSVDMAEEQLRDRTASSQVLVHFLKLGTVKARIELEKLKQENKLLEAKTEAIQSAKRMDEVYLKAIQALRTYSGNGNSNEQTDEELF